MEKIIVVTCFFLIPVICYYFAKKNDQWNYSWKDIFFIIIFSCFWSFLNIFIHECGHALTAKFFGYTANEVSVGIGSRIISLGGGEYTEINFNLFPVDGFTDVEMGNISQELIILAMGVITQFLFLGLVYWLLKRNKKWQETLIGHFVYLCAVKIAFWLTFVLNFPFVQSDSDWTKIVKLIFHNKWN